MSILLSFGLLFLEDEFKMGVILLKTTNFYNHDTKTFFY
jgi:hypothetical protein